MKKLILLFCTLFSLSSFAGPKCGSSISYTSEDFDIFPLTVSNSSLIGGVWTGRSVLIEIEGMDSFDLDSDVFMWVTITNKETSESKAALLYHHDEHGGYELYVFDPGISVPLEIMIFKYTDKVAVERNMKCPKGGYIMRLQFQLSGNESQAVQLQRETCSNQ